MTTNVTHSCGHTIEHEADYSEWFAETLSRRVCRECFRAQYEASVAAAREASRKLPALVGGTEKQIAWATKLRLEIMEEHPGLRPLAKYVTHVRRWIDFRDHVQGTFLHAREGARKAEDFEALARAVGLELGAWLKAHAKNDCDESVVGLAMMTAMDNLFGIASDSEGRCYTAAWIAAERDAFAAAVVDAFPEVGASVRPALDTVIDASAKGAQKKLAAIEKARADEQAARIAEERRRKLAEEAAAARAKAAAEALALRWQPFRAELKKPLSWDAEDGYWTRRRNKRFEALSIDTLERHGVAALRIVLALPNKAALKAAENASAERLLSVAYDAQALAELVGPSAARHMHVEAGLPKPVIKKKAGETQKAPAEAGRSEGAMLRVDGLLHDSPTDWPSSEDWEQIGERATIKDARALVRAARKKQQHVVYRIVEGDARVVWQGD